MDGWGCLDEENQLTLAFKQGKTTVAMEPTRSGGSFELVLPEGRYDIEVVRPRGTRTDPSSVEFSGGLIRSSDLLWPVE